MFLEETDPIWSVKQVAQAILWKQQWTWMTTLKRAGGIHQNCFWQKDEPLQGYFYLFCLLKNSNRMP